MHLVGRIEEAEIANHARVLQQRQGLRGLALLQLVSCRDPERRQVFAQQSRVPFCRLDEIDLPRASAERFDAHGAGSGVQVEPHAAPQIVDGGEHVEERLPQPVAGGAQVEPRQRAQRTATVLSGNDAHGSGGGR